MYLIELTEVLLERKLALAVYFNRWKTKLITYTILFYT